MVVDHPIGRDELITRVGESADHHHRALDRPGEPRQTARQADEGGCVAQPARPLDEGPVTGLILGAVRGSVTTMPAPWIGFLINADHAVAVRL